MEPKSPNQPPADDTSSQWDAFEPDPDVHPSSDHGPPSSPPPALNLPTVIVVLVGAFVAMHVLRTMVLGRDGQETVILALSFIPATVTRSFVNVPSDWVALWTPFTHAFLHGDWLHLGVNSLWLVAFGSAVAKRIGTIAFVVFFALGSGAGALAHYFTHAEAMVPVIGASGAVSACMGAAVRFAFTQRGITPNPETAPRLSLVESFKNPTVLAFVGIWFALNWVFGSGVVPIPGAEGEIAWQAHVGGFLFGLLLFAFFDRRSPPGRAFG